MDDFPQGEGLAAIASLVVSNTVLGTFLAYAASRHIKIYALLILRKTHTLFECFPIAHIESLEKRLCTDAIAVLFNVRPFTGAAPSNQLSVGVSLTRGASLRITRTVRWASQTLGIELIIGSAELF